MKAYEEIAEWIASGPSVREVANYQASASVKEAVSNLLRKEKAAGLMPDEKSSFAKKLPDVRTGFVSIA